MFQTYREVIDLWPSLAALSEDTGATIEQVRKWRQRGKIPGEWWLPVAQAAPRRRILLSVEDLAGIASGGDPPPAKDTPNGGPGPDTAPPDKQPEEAA